ncbi:MAG: cupin domain-containing protein [Terriglobales bacterium]
MARLGLEPHPEGGWFRRIHSEARCVTTSGGSRPLATSIHYLLDRARPRGFFHRNRSTILHYLQHGGPVDYFLLNDAGTLRRARLGLAPGEQLFLAVPGGVWKASRLPPESDFALVSEVVVPGFDYADHAFLTREMLGARFPWHLDDLSDLLRPD